MELFPAIDILDGQCVRLLRGELNKVTVYGDPVAYAKKWAESGARFLHIVDLDGAFEGSGKNLKIIEKIKKETNLFIQTGGGIRSIEDIQRRIDAGIDRVILGTIIYTDIKTSENALNKFGAKSVAAGLDAKNGFLSIKGWTQATDMTAIEAGKDLFSKGFRTVIYTDISRDGALVGVNYEACFEMSKTGLDVIASGGVKSIEDITNLKNRSIYGAILGKSLYEGTINLKEAISLAV